MKSDMKIELKIRDKSLEESVTKYCIVNLKCNEENEKR